MPSVRRRFRLPRVLPGIATHRTVDFDLHRALSIAERITGDHALRAVYQSGGSVLTCLDKDALEAMKLLVRQGLALEMASAAALGLSAADCIRRERWRDLGHNRFRRGSEMGKHSGRF